VNAFKLIVALFRIFYLTFQSIFLLFLSCPLIHIELVFYFFFLPECWYILENFLLTSYISEPYVR